MDFGVAIVSTVDAWKTVKRAEELGFTHAWFYDSQILAPDIFVSMALAADEIEHYLNSHEAEPRPKANPPLPDLQQAVLNALRSDRGL